MKYFLIFLLTCFPSLANSVEVPYAWNNSSQQYYLKRGIYVAAIEQSKNSKCTINIETTIPESFIVNYKRSVDTILTIYRDGKYIQTIKQNVSYETFMDFEYKLYNVIKTKCQ